MEEVIAATVSDCAQSLVPGDRSVSETAVAAALHSFAGGASVAEACEAGRRMVASWSRHPSRPDGGVWLAAAS